MTSSFDTATLTPPASARYDELALVRTMLPAIREDFRALLPGDTARSDIQDQVNKIALGSTLSKAQVVGTVLGLTAPDDAYHILGTTRAIYDDLRTFYEQHGHNDRTVRGKALCARQNTLYTALEAFKLAALEPLYAETQLLVGRYVRDVVPPVRKPAPQGFGG